MFILDRIKRYFRDVRRNSKTNLKKIVSAAPFWVIIVSVVLLAVGSIRAVTITQDRYDTRMNTVWSQGGDDYRHVAVYAGGARTGGMAAPMRYVDPETSIKRSDLSIIRTSLQSAADTLNESSNKRGLNNDGTPNNWEDCWSSWLTDNIKTVPESGSSAPALEAECDIVAVGGNFKAFHPFMYMSGGFLPEVCTDPQLIVINDVLAWRFFSSYDVVGFHVSLWGKTYTIGGVVSEPDSSMDKKAGTHTSRAYIYFSTLETEFPAGDAGQDIAIQCYEAFLPEAVKGVAVNDMKAALPNYSSDDPKMLVVSVTGRLFFTKIWQSMVPIGSDDVPDGIELPYWEKASRIATEHLFVDMILVIIGTITLIVGIIMAVLKFRKFALPGEPGGDDEDEDEDAPAPDVPLIEAEAGTK